MFTGKNAFNCGFTPGYAEPPVRIELLSTVLIRESNPVLAAKRQ
jgi:hypothetical protein